MHAFFGEFLIPLSIDFSSAHGPKVVTCEADKDHENKAQQRIEVPRNSGDKRAQFAFKRTGVFQRRPHGRRPRGNGRNDADGGRRTVDDVRKLFAADAVKVRQGSHDGTDREAVKVVVDKDRKAQTTRCEQR